MYGTRAAKAFAVRWTDLRGGLRKETLGCYFAPSKSSKYDSGAATRTVSHGNCSPYDAKRMKRGRGQSSPG